MDTSILLNDWLKKSDTDGLYAIAAAILIAFDANKKSKSSRSQDFRTERQIAFSHSFQQVVGVSYHGHKDKLRQMINERCKEDFGIEFDNVEFGRLLEAESGYKKGFRRPRVDGRKWVVTLERIDDEQSTDPIEGL